MRNNLLCGVLLLSLCGAMAQTTNPPSVRPVAGSSTTTLPPSVAGLDVLRRPDSLYQFVDANGNVKALVNPITTNTPSGMTNVVAGIVAPTFASAAANLAAASNALWEAMAAGTNSVIGALNVLAFGATGNGVTDDTLALQTAFDAVKATQSNTLDGRSSKVYIPNGTYIVTGTIRLPAGGVSIAGQSRDGVIVKNNGLTNWVFWGESNPTNTVTLPLFELQDMTIVQGAVAQTDGGAICLTTTSDVGGIVGNRVVLRNITIQRANSTFGFATGIKIRNVQGGTMEGCSIHYASGNGVYMDGFTTMFSIRNTWSAGNGGNGFDLRGWAYSSVESSGADSNERCGWNFDRIEGEQTVLNNTLHVGAEQNKQAGVRVGYAQYTEISAFVLAKSGGSTTNGIVIDGSYATTLRNCSVSSAISGSGYALLVTNVYGAQVNIFGGFFADWGRGNVGNPSEASLNWVGYASEDRTGIGVLNYPGQKLTVRHGYYNTTKSCFEMARFSFDSTNQQGSAFVSVTGDGGDTFAQWIQYSQTSPSYFPGITWATNADTIIRNSYSGASGGRISFAANTNLVMSLGTGSEKTGVDVPGVLSSGSVTVTNTVTANSLTLTGYPTGPTNATAPTDAVTIKAWKNYTNASGGVFKEPLYQ